MFISTAGLHFTPSVLQGIQNAERVTFAATLASLVKDAGGGIWRTGSKDRGTDMVRFGYVEVGSILVPTWSDVGREELERREQDVHMLDQMRELSFGCYAWVDSVEKRRVMEAGSGILVAPQIGITARHVCEGFGNLDAQFEGLRRRSTPLDRQYEMRSVNADYGAKVYQIPAGNPTPVGEEELVWGVKLTWPSHDTDAAVMRLEPRTAASVAIAPHLRFLEWQLLPPPVGEMVRLWGFPDPTIEIEGINHLVEAGLSSFQARVMEHVYPMQAHSYEFPAFRLDQTFGHGFSGGPVTYKGRLVGIYPGPDLVACLWPFALMTYPDANGIEHSFKDLFEDGTINVVDWPQVKGRVARKPCEEALAGSTVEGRCPRQHVVLTA